MTTAALAADALVPDAPPPELRYRHRIHLGTALRSAWRSRALVRTLAERDLRARYKQAVLGFAWAVVPGLATVLVFTLLFDRVAKINTGGAPYVLFAYLGLVPWNFFSASVSNGGTSLVGNVSLLNKVSCPREVFPWTAVVVASVDALVSLVALVGLFFATGTTPRAATLWVPVYLAIQLAFTVGVTMILAILIVYLRDLRHLLPLVLQLGLFATPVAYGLNVISTIWKPLYVAANPLALAIDGYRRSILFGQGPAWGLLGIATATSLVALLGGYHLFKRLEPGIADVA